MNFRSAARSKNKTLSRLSPQPIAQMGRAKCKTYAPGENHAIIHSHVLRSEFLGGHGGQQSKVAGHGPEQQADPDQEHGAAGQLGQVEGDEQDGHHRGQAHHQEAVVGHIEQLAPQDAPDRVAHGSQRADHSQKVVVADERLPEGLGRKEETVQALESWRSWPRSSEGCQQKYCETPFKANSREIVFKCQGC